jgi:putative transposase
VPARHAKRRFTTASKIAPGQLTLHADRGGAMRNKPVALLLADLGVVKTHSRPYVSNDNPFSEAQFRTLKYCPQFLDRFGSIEDGRAFGQQFFRWYNQDHCHSGLGFFTPAVVHFSSGGGRICVGRWTGRRGLGTKRT